MRSLSAPLDPVTTKGSKGTFNPVENAEPLHFPNSAAISVLP
jgi:hypothetical protein